MPSADRLEEFTKIVAEGSISGAARLLDLPRATLSRRLADLEEELGVRLVHRRTRSLTLTRAGEELFQHARRISAQTALAWNAVRRLDDTPRGLLRVSVGEGIDADLFLDFLSDYPEVELIIQSSSRYVDLVAEGIDVAIRYGEVTDPELYVRTLTQISTLVVASPDYLRKNGRPACAEDLHDHICIRRAFKAGEPTTTWPRRSGGTVAVNGRFAANDLTLLRAAALRAEGLAMLPRPAVAQDLRTGQLVAVLEQELGTEFPVCLTYADREYIEPQVRAFVDYAADRLPQWFDTLNTR